MKADLYDIVLFFPRLFPDPAVFEDPVHLANRYLLENGVSREKSDLVYQTTNEIDPIDERGKQSIASGTAKYSFEGRSILAEYMSNANIRLAYADFGTGLTPSDHSRLWSKGKIRELRFELRQFKHQATTFNLPEFSELYQMMKERATPTTLSTIELDNVPAHAFGAAVAHLKGRLLAAAQKDDFEVEVYAAQDLSPSERSGLEKRIGRESNRATIFVILSRKNVSTVHPVIG